MKILALLSAAALASCAVTTAPDGTRTQTVDPIAYHAALAALEAYAYAHAIHSDK